MALGSWLKSHGLWLMVYGLWLMVRGSRSRPGSLGCQCRPMRFFLGQEPGAMSLQQRAMRNEPLTISNGFTNWSEMINTSARKFTFEGFVFFGFLNVRIPKFSRISQPLFVEDSKMYLCARSKKTYWRSSVVTMDKIEVSVDPKWCQKSSGIFPYFQHFSKSGPSMFMQVDRSCKIAKSIRNRF